MKRTLEQLVVRFMPRIVAGLCVVALLLIGVSIFTVAQYQATSQKVDETQTAQVYGVREGQYINCVKVGNSLRRQVRREFVDLKRSVLIPVYSNIAATLPQGTEARRILTGAVVYMHKRIRTIKSRIPNVPCQKSYPPLPGQTYDQVRPDRYG
jgi:hypothetical protein